MVLQRTYLCQQHAEEIMAHLQRLGLRVSTFKGKVIDLLDPDGDGEDGPLAHAG